MENILRIISHNSEWNPEKATILKQQSKWQSPTVGRTRRRPYGLTKTLRGSGHRCLLKGFYCLLYSPSLCDIFSAFNLDVVHSRCVTECVSTDGSQDCRLYFVSAVCVFASSMYVHSIGSNLGMFTNPGAVPHNAYPFVTISGRDGDLLQRCGICDAYKPKKSHHCRFAVIFCVHRIGFVTDAF